MQCSLILQKVEDEEGGIKLVSYRLIIFGLLVYLFEITVYYGYILISNRNDVLIIQVRFNIIGYRCSTTVENKTSPI